MARVKVSFHAFEILANQMQYASLKRPEILYQIPACWNLTIDDIKRIIAIWQHLNLETYHIQYSENGTETPYLSDIRFNRRPVSPFQALKYFTFMEGFIDTRAIEQTRNLSKQELDAMDLLKAIIREILETIVVQLPEYL